MLFVADLSQKNANLTVIFRRNITELPCEKQKSTQDNAKNVNFNLRKFPGFLEAADPIVTFTGGRKQLVRRTLLGLKWSKSKKEPNLKLSYFLEYKQKKEVEQSYTSNLIKLDRKLNYEIALTQCKLRYTWYNISKL